jgi:predicted peroxiredoxin
VTARILYATSFGSDDATRATIPFIAASGAIEAGHEPEIALRGEATYLVKNGVAEHIHGVGCAPLVDLWPKLIEHRIPVYV